MKLNNLTPAEGSVHKPIRIGRGQGSGKGGTSTKGHKGGQSRTGYKEKPGFEGGQMPMHRRTPKFGFINPTRVEFTAVNLGDVQRRLNDQPELAGIQLDITALATIGLVRNPRLPVKVLAGKGAITSPISIQAHKFSASAKAAIEAAGGQAIELDLRSDEVVDPNADAATKKAASKRGAN